MGAGTALIFGRRVKTLTFTRRVGALPPRILEDVAISYRARETRRARGICGTCSPNYVRPRVADVRDARRQLMEGRRNACCVFTVGLAASAARPARITGVHLSFHMSVARMVNCKLSGLLRATVPGGNQGVEGRGGL